MAPERWLSREVTAANDIYAFGLILFEMITRRRALTETNLQKLLSQIRVPHRATALASQLPPKLIVACEAMLAIEPDKRPNADEVCQQLRDMTISTS